MGRWTQYDEDEYRLPEGMKRTGYDADTGRYYYQDKDGSVWQGAEGAEFSEMTKVSDGPGRASSGTAGEDYDHWVEDDDIDVEAAPTGARSDGYHTLPSDSTRHDEYASSSNSSAYRTLFPFFLIIAVVLLLAWRLVVSPVLSVPPSACPKGLGTHAYWVQPGDTCWVIAKTAGCSLDELRRLNGKVDCATLMPGTTLCLPAPAPPT